MVICGYLPSINTHVTTRRPLDAQAIGLMLLLCFVWSVQQIALKAMAAEIKPLMQIALRSCGSALLVYGFMRWRGERLSLANGIWRPGLVVGLLFALEFLMIGEGLRHTSAAHLVVFLYTAPLFAALGLHVLLPAERLARVQWLGVVLAFAGIAVAFLWEREPHADWQAMLWGDVLALLAGAAWGATTVVVRTTRLAALNATQTLFFQLAVAGVLLMLAAWGMGQAEFVLTPRVALSLAFHTVVVAFASFLVWFWLLRHYLASRLGVFSFLTPLMGIVLGSYVLNEPIEPGFRAGALMVLTGIVLVSGYGWFGRWLESRASRPSP